MNLRMTKQAHKFVEGLDAKQYRQVVSTVLALTREPSPHDSKAMHGAKHGERRVDVGEYRIIYAFSEELVDIIVVGKRNGDEVYKIWNQSQ